MNKQKEMAALRKEWSDCQRCHLAESRNHVVFGEGNPDADILIVGEGPGENEDKKGQPFVGKAGLTLERFLEVSKLNPMVDLFITNIVGCRPTIKVPDDNGIMRTENRKPNKVERESCRERLMKTIYIVDPLLIITLGGVSTQALCGKAGASIMKARGMMQTMHFAGHYAEIRYPVLPMYHPAYLDRLYNYEEGGDWALTAEDFLLACDVIDHLRKVYRGIDPPDRTVDDE